MQKQAKQWRRGKPGEVIDDATEFNCSAGGEQCWRPSLAVGMVITADTFMRYRKLLAETSPDHPSVN